MAAAPARRAICLLGPTASGKSRLAMALATHLPVEIVSVDSVQVFRGMDIGTAKPDAADRARVVHHLIDVADPAERYSAGRFRREALTAMAAIAGRGRVPLLVGGTNLYFRALRDGLAPLPEADPEVRAALDAAAGRLGWPALHARLACVDPAAARRIGAHDRQRIQRALEVFALTGQPLSGLQATGMPAAGWHFLTLALMPGDRAVLGNRIAERFVLMMEQGLLDEVYRLYQRTGLTAASPAIRAVGYRQLWRHLDGELELDAAVERAVIATRRLAKRQLTWLRAERVDCRVDPLAEDALPAFLAASEAFLESGS